MLIRTTVAALVLTASTVHAECDPPETWSFDETTSGEDIAWTSPTAVATDAPRYLFTTEITLVEVTATFLSIPLTVDVTDQVPPEQLVNSVIFDGPLPVSVPPIDVVYPAPPEPPGVSATIEFSLDAGGFANLGLTNVVLGDVEVDLGPPFGVQTVTITSVRVAGNISAQGIGPAADVNGDCVVDFADLLEVLSAWGTCAAPPCAADVDGDGVIGFADLLLVLSSWS